MRAANECAQLIGVESSIFYDCELPKRVVDVANREFTKPLESGDSAFLQLLRAHSGRFSDGAVDSGGTKTMKQVLERIAKGCGMELVMEEKRRTGRGDRSYYYPSIKFKRLLPEMMDDWLVYSDRLSRDHCELLDRRACRENNF